MNIDNVQSRTDDFKNTYMYTRDGMSVALIA